MGRLKTPEAQHISIHAPLAGCDELIKTLMNVFIISIHAPLAGCDHLPRRQAVVLRDISIHAPLAGCDGNLNYELGKVATFQSTHPLRGATGGGVEGRVGNGDFNPRTPCGVRH